jgi:hypothetical protein
MPTRSIKGSTLLVYLDTESNQTLNLFVMKKKKLVAVVVGTCTTTGTAVSCHNEATEIVEQDDHCRTRAINEKQS